ncbi:MAG: PEGA domain-containing protein [Microgenomates group bacterium]
MKIIQRLILLIAFIGTLILVIAYARGYRLDFKKKSFTPTGILAISSSPKAAKIYINGLLKGATDTNLTLPPGNYHVEIKKEGFTSWSKNVNLKGELVLTLEASLFPLNPSLSPLTNLGIIKAVPLDATEKILLFTQNGDFEKDGIYLYEASKNPITFFSPLKLIALKKNLPETFDLAKAEVIFSPDYKQAIIEFPISNIEYQIAKVAYLFSLDSENQQPFDVSSSKQTLIEAWEKEKEEQKQKILNSFPKEITKIASDSFHIVAFSPDETKILYRAKKDINLPPVLNPPLIATNQTEQVRAVKKDSLYVYDKKENWIKKDSQGSEKIVTERNIIYKE